MVPFCTRKKLYFAAGVWPLEGVFIFCLDAATGNVIWRNDNASFIYGQHPHNTEAFGGLAPQGYLLIDGEDLIVPGSNAYPARFDLKTGKIKEFELPAPGPTFPVDGSPRVAPGKMNGVASLFSIRT